MCIFALFQVVVEEYSIHIEVLLTCFRISIDSGNIYGEFSNTNKGIYKHKYKKTERK